MALNRLTRSISINMTGAAAAVAGTLYIVWVFGLAEFAYFTINLAKLALLLLAAELVPGNFALFRLQDDERFADAFHAFTGIIAIVAAAVAALLIAAGVFVQGSWFMLLYVVSASFQRSFDIEAQARGRVDLFYWIPAITNISRLLLMVGLSGLKLMPASDVIWASLAIGGVVGQAAMLSRFPSLRGFATFHRPAAKVRYLWSIRASYRGYYLNSVLKRLRDTFLPIFCDLVFPSKAQVGRLFVYTRAIEAVCAQVRVIEAFTVNRALREQLRHVRRHIFWLAGPAAHTAVAGLALLLMYRHGIGMIDLGLALLAGFFVYPYILELFFRNDALADFSPGRVTISLLAFLVGLAVPPLISLLAGGPTVALLISSYVLGQALSAATYLLRRGRHTGVQA